MLSLLQISDFAMFENTYSNLAVLFKEDGGEFESIVVWLSLCRESVEVQNKIIETSYDSKLIKENLHELKEIAENGDGNSSLENARKWLNKYGIYLVIHDALRNSKIRGAVTRYKNNPAIYLSLRFKTHDHAWFALMHEIGHLLIDYNGKDPFLTCVDDEATREENEEEADKFAQNFFINSADYNRYIKDGQISIDSVLRFAFSQKVHPGIVVARLQHDRIISFSKFNTLKSRFTDLKEFQKVFI